LPGPPMSKGLWEWIWQETSTSSRKSKDEIRHMWAHTILLETRCIHMTCSLNELTLQFLQVPLVCYGALYKNWSNTSLPTDCKPHGTLCRMKWHPHDSVHLQKPEPHVLHVYKTSEVQMGFITKP
jgi:hypothetical protein